MCQRSGHFAKRNVGGIQWAYSEPVVPLLGHGIGAIGACIKHALQGSSVRQEDGRTMPIRAEKLCTKKVLRRHREDIEKILATVREGLLWVIVFWRSASCCLSPCRAKHCPLSFRCSCVLASCRKTKSRNRCFVAHLRWRVASDGRSESP